MKLGATRRSTNRLSFLAIITLSKSRRLSLLFCHVKLFFYTTWEVVVVLFLCVTRGWLQGVGVLVERTVRLFLYRLSRGRSSFGSFSAFFVRRDFTRRFCWFTSCWAMRSLLCRSCLHVFGLVVLLFKKLFRNKLRGILLHFVKLDLKRQAFSARCFHLQLCMLCVVFIFRQCCILFRRLSKLFSHLSFHLNDLSQLSIQLEFLLNEML